MEQLHAAIGWDAARTTELAELGIDHVRAARVTRVDGPLATVVLDDGSELRIATATTVAAGDWVALDGDAVAAVLERRTVVERLVGDSTRPGSGVRRVVAANVDRAFVVRPLDLPVRASRLLALVALAREGGALPGILLTKADLHTAPDEALAEATRMAPAIDVLVLSTVDGRGLDDLAALVRGTTFTLIGESGAGKSTIVNALAGRDVLATQETRRDGSGRHTTTYRELVPLPSGGAAIDTPGVRMAHFSGDAAGLDGAYADIVELASACRFRDCAHDTEPGCAVRTAIDDGELLPERLAAYERAQREMEWRQRQDDPGARRERARAVRARTRAHRRDAW